MYVLYGHFISYLEFYQFYRRTWKEHINYIEILGSTKYNAIYLLMLIKNNLIVLYIVFISLVVYMLPKTHMCLLC